MQGGGAIFAGGWLKKLVLESDCVESYWDGLLRIRNLG